MALSEWGTFMGSFDRGKDAAEYVRLLNVALSKVPLTMEEKLAVEFHVKVTFTPKTGKKRYGYTWTVYAKGLPEGSNNEHEWRIPDDWR